MIRKNPERQKFSLMTILCWEEGFAALPAKSFRSGPFDLLLFLGRPKNNSRSAAKRVKNPLTSRFCVQDGRGRVQTPAAGGAGGPGISTNQRSARGDESSEGSGRAAEDDQSGVATVNTHVHAHTHVHTLQVGSGLHPHFGCVSSGWRLAPTPCCSACCGCWSTSPQTASWENRSDRN